MTTTAQTMRYESHYRRCDGRGQREEHLLRPQAAAGRRHAGLLRPDPRRKPHHDGTSFPADRRLYRRRAALAKRNVVEAPTLQFDRDQRSSLAGVASGVASGEGTVRSQPVSTVLVQVDKRRKSDARSRIISAHLTYADAERKILLTGGVTAKGSDATMTSRQMTIFLAANQSKRTSRGRAQVSPGQVDRIVAENNVVVVATDTARDGRAAGLYGGGGQVRPDRRTA